jgi:6-phosphogluconolactonase
LAANQNTDNIVLFRIDRKSGRLAPTGDDLKTPSPVCLISLRAQ